MSNGPRMKIPMQVPIVGEGKNIQDPGQAMMERRNRILESYGLFKAEEVLDAIIDATITDLEDRQFVEKSTDPKMLFDRRQHHALMAKLDEILEKLNDA